jgi:phage shock protein A
MASSNFSILFDKVRVGVFARMNKLLDDNLNTPDDYKQRIRDLEIALADLRSAHDEAVGGVNGLQRQITGLNGANASDQADIDLLIGDDDPSNDGSAINMQLKVEDRTEEITSLATVLEQAQTQKSQLDTAVAQLEAKHAEMVRNLKRLTLTAASTSSLNRASGAIEAAGTASNAAGSVDDIQSRLNSDADTAKARFDRVVVGLNAGTNDADAVRLARAKAALDARRQKIVGEATSTSAGAPA